MALTLGAALAVASLPFAGAALAAGPTISLTGAPSGVIGLNNTFTVNVVANAGGLTVTGVSASITFDNAIFTVQSAAYAATGWGDGTTYGHPYGPIANAVAPANSSGVFGHPGGIAANQITPFSPSGDLAFYSVTFKVTSCPSDFSTRDLGFSTAAGDPTYFDNGGTTTTPTLVGATVTPCAANDFNIGASPTSVTIAQGATSSPISIQTTYVAGTPGAVSLAVTDNNSGTGSAAFGYVLGLSSVTPTQSTTLQITAGTTTTAPADYIVTVTGTGPNATHHVDITVHVTLPPAGPPAQTGNVTVTGSINGANDYLGVSAPTTASIFLGRNSTDTASVPVIVFSNTQWTLQAADSMVGGKAVSDRGHMLDLGPGSKRLASPAVVQVLPAGFGLTGPWIPTTKYKQNDGVTYSGLTYVWTPATVGTGVITSAPGTDPGWLLLPAASLDSSASAQTISASSALTQTVTVTLSQLAQPVDPPGNYQIDITFSAISGF